MEIFKESLEYIKVLIWPGIAIGFILYFRGKISNLIDRITIIKGPGGTEVRAEYQKNIQAQKESLPEVKEQNIEKAVESQVDVVKKEYEGEIKKLEADKNSKENIIKYLLNELSTKNIQLDFERIYQFIFGSQTDFLRRLISSHEIGEKSKDSIFFFVTLQYINPILKSWTFVQYIQFLLSNSLIVEVKESFYITDKGKAFISYIDILNYPKKSL